MFGKREVGEIVLQRTLQFGPQLQKRPWGIKVNIVSVVHPVLVRLQVRKPSVLYSGKMKNTELNFTHYGEKGGG